MRCDWNEELTTASWKHLKAFNIPNTYILAGGMKSWLKKFNHLHDFKITNNNITTIIGDNHPAAQPPEEILHHLKFEEKVKLENVKKIAGGGCG